MSLESVPEYALSFSEDAVHLQRRDKASGEVARPAWRHLGSVDFDSADFRDDFTRLRLMAGGADSLPVTLIIPDDQILYTTLTVAPGADRSRSVGKALDGLTPYAIEDLAFDWEGDGDSVRVAAVARQTLREARDFAAQYGFDGRDFRAAPQDDHYVAEPVFVLDPPHPSLRTRPLGDPAQAGVTSAGLQFAEDKAETADAAEAEDSMEVAAPDLEPDLDLDLGGDSAGTTDSDGPAAEVAPEAAPEPAEAEPEPAVAEVVPEPAVADVAPETAEAQTQAQAEDPAEPVAPEVVAAEAPVADDAQPVTDAVIAPPAVADPVAPADGDAPEMPATAEAAAEVAAAIPVVRHAPTPGAEPAAPMNPRARAVHDRAAGARQARATGAAPAPGLKPGTRGGMVGLIGMLAALVAGLVLIWAFVVPGDQTQTASSPAQTPATSPAQVPAATAPATAVSADAARTTAQAAPQTAATAETSTTRAPQSATGVAGAGATPDTPSTVTPSAVTPSTVSPSGATPTLAAPQVAAPRTAATRISALTEDEQRRVIVAAAAVAAAVVPPSAHGHGTAAAPQPATSAAAIPATPQPTAVRPKPARTEPTATPSTAPTPAERSRAASPPATAPAQTVRLSSSARPQLSPRRSTPQTTTPRADTAPRVPSDPLPYASSQSAVQQVNASRPPGRAQRPGRAPQAATQTRAETGATTAPVLRGSARPPGRPEGSTPEQPEGDVSGALLTPGESAQLRALIRDLGRDGLARVPAVVADPGARLAQARPLRKPSQATASDAVTPSAVDAALRAATTPPPDKPGRSETAATPARDSGGLLRGSMRPQRRPGAAGGASAASVTPSAGAVDAALSAAARTAPSATPGAVQLSALASSPLPPRRNDTSPAAPDSPAAPQTAATPGAAAPAAAPAAPAAAGPSDAEMNARRALDEQLQAQAEARIRARAQADAAAEARARAQAEARARAQAAAEEQAARASRQAYKPPEVDNEPEIAATALSQGVSSAGVARTATQSRGLDTGRTTIIGIIGAGQASRALIRLRSGKVVTVRLGDRIDGGTINSIGDGRLTYVKSGQTRELRMLDGR